MNQAHIIKRAILSEKSYKQMESGIYTFFVDKISTKREIAKSIEKQFQVNVTRVNTANISTKTKKIPRTRKTTTVGGGKKALVTLQKGQSIALFTTKKESKFNKAKDKKLKSEIKESGKSKKKGLLSRFRKIK